MTSFTKIEKILKNSLNENSNILIENNKTKNNKKYFKTFSFFRKKCFKINPRKYNDIVWLNKKIISMAGIKNNILPQIGIICGSGLNNIADKLEQPIILPFDKLPGFPLPSVNGHKGNVIFGWLGGKYCICLQGRFHPYEHNMDMALCTMPVRLMAMMGIKTLIASNAAGGINSNLNIGDLMIIKDHIFMPGLMGFSPLVGLKDKRFGNRFVSMQNAYDQKLRKKALILAENIGISAKEGVYVMNAGPHYETVAECSLAARLGGDALGMSTCHEIMVARQLGIRCFAFSLITNCSSLDLNNPLDVCHSDVLEIGIKVGEKTSEWITQLIKTLDEEEEIIKIKD